MTTPFPACYGIRLFAHETACDDIAKDHNSKMSKLAEILNVTIENRNPESNFEKTLIFCGGDIMTRKTTMGMKLKKFETCLFTSDMYADVGSQTLQENLKFLQTARAIALCSFETFAIAKLPLVQQYIFIEFPEKMTQFPDLLQQLKEAAVNEKQIVRIDVIVSNHTNENWLKALTMEMHLLKMDVPDWIIQTLTKNKDVEEKKDKLQFVEIQVQPDQSNAPAPTTNPVFSGTVTNASIVTKPIPVSNNTISRPVVKNEEYDPFNAKPNAEGKYVIPSRAITGCDENGDEIDYSEDEMDSDYDERQYDYENFHSFDHAEELEYEY